MFSILGPFALGSHLFGGWHAQKPVSQSANTFLRVAAVRVFAYQGAVLLFVLAGWCVGVYAEPSTLNPKTPNPK